VSERGRFATLTLVLLVAVVISAVINVQRIEMQLLAAAQVALSSAGIPFYGVEVDGRDVSLRGFVPSAEFASRLVSTVSTVPGVRAVHDETVVERVASRRYPVVAGLVPEMRIQRLGSRVRISGLLPAGGTAAAWVDALSSRFDPRVLESALQEDPRVVDAAWVREAEALTDLIAELGSGGVLAIRGGIASLSGIVAGGSQRDRIVERGRSIPALEWRFDLFSLDGSAGGGGA